VDDEPDLLEILRYNLENAGYAVMTAESAQDALDQGIGKADLLLLDVMMPGMSGFELAQHIKADPATADIPVIFLTARDSESDIVGGLNLGADDYIAKPFSVKEVLARITAVLRRAQPHPAESADPEPLCVEGLILDPAGKSVTIDGEPAFFTRTEFDILHLLLSHPGRVFSRADLLKHVWPEDVIVTERTVDVNITRIRKKLGPYADRIGTRSGFGYCFLP